MKLEKENRQLRRELDELRQKESRRLADAIWEDLRPSRLETLVEPQEVDDCTHPPDA